jgi:DNA-binding response OmpR family regulator
MSIEPAWKTEHRSPRILIVDDDSEIADPVRFALEALGFEVVHMPDGRQGAAKLDTYHPDLMILDMMMPGQSGFLVLEHVRRHKMDRLRIIMVTANEGERHESYARMLGVDDYIHKPFAIGHLMTSVQRLLEEPFPDSDLDSPSPP